MDGTGKVLSDEARPSDEESFMSAFKPVNLLLGARKAVESKKTKKGQVNLALIEAVFDPKEEDLPKLKKASQQKGLNPEITTLFNEMIATWPIRKAFDKGQEAISAARSARDRDAMNAANKALNQAMYELFGKGQKVESGGSKYFVPFWIGVAEVSIEKKDKKSGSYALDMLEKKFKDNERAMEYFKSMREKLG